MLSRQLSCVCLFIFVGLSCLVMETSASSSFKGKSLYPNLAELKKIREENGPRPNTAEPRKRGDEAKRGKQYNINCPISASNLPPDWLRQTPHAKAHKDFVVTDCSGSGVTDKDACMTKNYEVFEKFSTEVVKPKFDKLVKKFFKYEKANNEYLKLFAKLAPVKAKNRTVQKATDDYGGDMLQVLDFTRGTIVFPTKEQLIKGICDFRKFAQDPKLAIKIIREKDGLKGDRAGYEDYKFNVRFEDATSGYSVCEIQFSYCAMFTAKSTKGHALYEQFRARDDSETEAIEAILQTSRKFYAVEKEKTCDMGEAEKLKME